eukprot:TRINITY_DN69_c0_g1_i2.p1 TRINITY_DN69_c0_g1~~TRINITY_DN69_c0_g1_i2.p1  ORF type:complete len:119 (-),score=63.13 TRINITY_DN69_c0_g1_i2:72-428(-)
MSGDSETSELACTYAALILHDDGVAITGDKIKALLDAAGVRTAPFWPGLFASALAKQNINDLLVSGGGGSAPAPAASGAAPSGGDKKEDKKEEKKEEKKKKEEPKEDSDADMGFGLFD